MPTYRKNTCPYRTIKSLCTTVWNRLMLGHFSASGPVRCGSGYYANPCACMLQHGTTWLPFTCLCGCDLDAQWGGFVCLMPDTPARMPQSGQRSGSAHEGLPIGLNQHPSFGLIWLGLLLGLLGLFHIGLLAQLISTYFYSSEVELFTVLSLII